jgi:hypothetical protein
MPFINTQKKEFEESKVESERARGWRPLFLSFLSCPDRHEHDWTSEEVLHLTGKPFHRNMTQSSVFRHNQKSVISHSRFFKKKKKKDR